MKFKYQTLVFDLETDGLLDTLTRIHVIHMHEVETGRAWTFRQNRDENTIERGLRKLKLAHTVVAHNGVHFDLKAIEKLYPAFYLKGKVRDTLPLARMVFANIKEEDFRMWNRGKLHGSAIGAHTLDAWGQRLGLYKGDYAKEMKEKGLDPWAEWNEQLEEYCVNDVNVTVLLWLRILREEWSEVSTVFEHRIHDLVGIQEENGFPFDMDAALELKDELEKECKVLEDECIDHYGVWWAPDKKYLTGPMFEDPKGGWKKKKYNQPRREFGEDGTRNVWAEVTVRKTSCNPKKLWKVDKKTGEEVLNFSYEAGAPYCKVQLKEFNPTSRPQIVDRFCTVYQWEPNHEEDDHWTDAGAPKVDDTILRSLAGRIPMAEELAEVFYYKKRLGQLAQGANAWIKRAVWNEEAGMWFIHHRCVTGGTVSGRASHSWPNLGQVPKVKRKKKPVWDEALGEEVMKEVTLKGREGLHGFECRSLFTVPKGWTLVGSDQAGIELRCLASFTYPYDGGSLLETVLEGDIHSTNQEIAGLPTRDAAKTFIYALIYGAGDIKLGSIVLPNGTLKEQKKAGKEIRARFMKGMPGYAAAMRELKKEWRRQGYVIGMDGRKLYPRGEHSLLNLRLQSDAAMLAKAWYIWFVEYMESKGFVMGWDGDFVVMAWVHDELQIAVRDELVDYVKKVVVWCAKTAPKHFGFKFHAPVDANADSGKNWGSTH